MPFFSIIDAPTKNISKHPLNLIARSGQENLIKHNVTTLLLQLKWKLVPRYAFYFNLFFYLLYLMLFTWYIIELSMESNEDIDFFGLDKIISYFIFQIDDFSFIPKSKYLNAFSK